MTTMLQTDIANRLEQVKQYIIDQKVDACVITSPVNLYYLNGFIFNGYMYIEPASDPLLFVKRPVTIEGDNVEHIRKPEQLPELIEARNMALPKSILLEADLTPYNRVLRFQKALHMPEVKGSISSFMRAIRTLKSEGELAQIRQSAQIHAQVYKQIPELYRPGITDLELQIEIEYIMRKHGSIGMFRSFGENMDIYMGNLLAGDNAQEPSPFDFALGGKGIDPLLPLGSANKVLKPGTSVMIDMAGNYTPYVSDMTRTFSVGKLPEEAYRAHQLSIDINNQIAQFAKEGVACSDIYDRTMEIVAENGMEPYFMGTTQQARFVGHGVGLEINEPPVFAARTRDMLKKNMAIALEPKFVLPGIGAVGVENTYFVTETGLDKVTICEEDIILLQ